MTTCIHKTTSPVVCVPLTMVILLSASAFAMGAGGGGAGDGHVGGPGISDLTSGTGSHGAAPGIVGGGVSLCTLFDGTFRHFGHGH